MDNPRPDKVATVTEVKERLEQSSSVLVTEYRGLSVKALADLRRSLRPAGGAYKVYKNTLVRRAASEAGIDIEEHLLGPTALTFTQTTPEGEAGDFVSVAKVLKDFSKTNPELIIKGGLLDGEPIDAAGIARLAELEPREVLLAKFAGLMAAPMQQFAGLLSAIPRDFAYGLKALIEKGGAADAPAGDTATDETPADIPAEDTGTDEAVADSQGDDAATDDVPVDDPSAAESTAPEENEPVAKTADEDGED